MVPGFPIFNSRCYIFIVCTCIIINSIDALSSHGSGNRKWQSQNDGQQASNPYFKEEGESWSQGSNRKSQPQNKQPSIPDDDDDDDGDEINSNHKQRSNGKFNDEFMSHLVKASEIDITKAVNSSNDFAGRFYSLLSDMHPNFNFSPVTMSIMMALFLRGSDGSTLKEIYDMMGYNSTGFENLREVQNGFHGLSHHYHKMNSSSTSSQASKTKFELSNSLWINDEKKINSRFIDDAGNYFHTKLYPISSKSTSSGSEVRQMLLKFADEKTNMRATSCSMKKGSLGESLQIIFLNLFYFKNFWNNDFSDYIEMHSNFKSFDHFQVKTKFIQGKTPVKHLKSDDYSAEILEVPLLDSPNAEAKYSLVVILPSAKSSLKKVENSIDSLQDVLHDMKEKASAKTMKVMIPKAIMNQESLKIDNYLSILGINSLFNPEKTELTYISAYERLSVSSIFHEASFDITKNGKSSQEEDDDDDDEPDDFSGQSFASKEVSESIIVNRPFIFMIVDKSLDSIVTLGRINSV